MIFVFLNFLDTIGMSLAIMLDDIPRNKRGHPSEKAGKSNKSASSERHHIQKQYFQSHFRTGLQGSRSRKHRKGIRFALHFDCKACEMTLTEA